MESKGLLPILNVPAQQTSGPVWLAVALLALLAVAIVVEFTRQRVQARRRLLREWETLRQIATERELSDDEWDRLRACIERGSPRDPLRAATVRQEFDRCVEREMTALRERGDPSAYEAVGAQLRDVRVRLGLDYVAFGQRIASTRELPPGQELWLAAASEGRPSWRAATVVAVDEAYLQVTPSDGELPPYIEAGGRVRGRAWRGEDGRYEFTVPVARIETNPPTLFLYHTSDLSRTQAREYFRIRYEDTLSVGILDPAPQEGDDSARFVEPQTWLRCRVTSLSAGGIALVASQPVPAHVGLRIPLELPDLDPLELNARIVGTQPVGAGHYLVRATFVDIPDEARDRLARFVALRQQAQTAEDDRE